MKKIKVLIQRYNAEIELVTSIDVQVGQHVIIHAPEGYEANGKYMTAEVVAVSDDVGVMEEKFVQKVETNYYDQMQLAKAEQIRMRAVMDKFWNEKTDQQKLAILETTEPPIEETVDPVEEPITEPVVEEPVVDETTPTDEVTP